MEGARLLRRAEIDPWRRDGPTSPTTRRCALVALTRRGCSSPRATASRRAPARSTRPRPAVPALRHPDPAARAGRRQPPDLLVPGMPELTASAARRPQGRRPHRARQHAGELRRRAGRGRRHDRVRRAARAPRRHRAAACSPTTTRTPAGATSLTLEEGLDHLAADAYAGIELDVDLKLPGYEERVVDALREHGLLERALISTMECRVHRPLREIAPGAARLVGAQAPPRPLADPVHALPGAPSWRRAPRLLPRRAARAIRGRGASTR